MEGIFNYIIKVENRYNNTVDVDGKELVVNTEITERDAIFVNRIATVVGLPRAFKSPVEVGDEVIVHHNVFRRWYDMKGNAKNGGSYIDENLYYVNDLQVFAYRRNGEWNNLPGFCFVSPIEGRRDHWDTSNELLEVGIMEYGPEELKGLTVGFTPNSEYEFDIEGKKLYRIYLNDIVWTSKKNARELLSQPKLLSSN